MSISEYFSNYRSYLFSVAYRMLGAVEEAEDMVQDAYLKIRHLEVSSIRNPKAYFAQVVTRLCLDRLEELRKERESYPGPWLPEPIPTEPNQELQDPKSISTAYLLLLEKLNPLERAVFLLRKAFDHSYEDISFIVNKSPENCRQIFSRSKKRLRNKEKRYDFDNRKAEAFLQQLIAYAEEGRYEELTRLFVEDAVVIADGGGKVRGALKHLLLGAEKAGKFVLGTTRKLSPVGSLYTKGEFNGAPAIIGSLNGQVFLVLSISHNGEQITELYALANPDKLKHLMA